MENNKYKKLIALIKEKGLVIKKSKCYDALSGWTGCNYVICDGDTQIFDLSINGYCFRESSVDEAIKAVENYTCMTLNEFKNWVDSVAIDVGDNRL